MNTKVQAGDNQDEGEDDKAWGEKSVEVREEENEASKDKRTSWDIVFQTKVNKRGGCQASWRAWAWVRDDESKRRKMGLA